MILWLFDRRNEHGFLPNLVKDESLVPSTDKWWDLCIKPPYSYEFRFLKYCRLDGVIQQCTLVNDYISGTASAYYPINLNFFDPEIDYIELMDEYSRERFKKGDFKVLFYYSEGDNPKSEIYDSLERMYSRHNITQDSVKFITANYKLDKQDPFVYFPDDEVYYRYLHVIENDYVKTHNLDRRSKKFTCLIRADKAWRRIYASFLYNLDIIKDGYFSYTGYKYQTTHKGIDDISQWENYNETLSQDILSFGLKIPFTCDELSDNEHNNHKLINHKFFDDAYFNLVVETHFDNDTIFLTEKTFKPILNLQPFLIIGNPGSLKLLKSLGYKTFTDVINEKYDQETNHKERMSMLIKMTYDLCNLSDNHHLRIQKIIAEVLEHNQKNFLSPKVHRINNMLNQLEYNA